MSHIHFTAKKNFVQELFKWRNPKFVFNVGAMGIEDLNNIKFRSKNISKKNII